jgi:predicted nucleic acid-binding Zn ribbon protein
MQKVSDPVPSECPSCHAKGTVDQLLSPPAVQFKGSGFYVTDYAKKSSAPAKSGDGKGEAKSETKTETKTSTDSASDKK